MESEYEYEKYICTKENVKKMLRKYGVAIIPNVLDTDECDKIKDSMWDYLEYVTQEFDIPIKKNDQTTWNSFKDLWPKHNMLLQHWSIGHAQFIWDIRQKSNIIDIFSKIYNTNDLLVSFDGASFQLPPEIVKFGWRERVSQSLHCDQSFLRNDFECVQSWVTANDVNVSDATFTFLEGSNIYHSKFREWVDNDTLFKNDWYKLEPEDELFYKDVCECKQKYIKCPAGSLVLWDSRTIHSGTEASKSRPIPNERLVVYLCYSPREWITNSALKRKLNAFTKLRTTNHWPHKPKMFPEIPRTYGKTLKTITQINPPKLSFIGRRLAGFDK